MYFDDPVRIGFGNGKAVSPVDVLPTGLRDGGCDFHQEASEALVVPSLGKINFQNLLQLVDIDSGVGHITTIRHGDKPMLLRIEFILNFTEQFLDDVFQGYHPFRAAELVDDDGHVGFHFLKQLEYFAYFLGFGHVYGGPHALAEKVVLFLLRRRRDEIFRIKNPHHLVDRSVVDRDAAEPGFDGGFHHLFVGAVSWDRNHVGAGHHDLLGPRVCKINDRLEQMLLILVEGSVICPHADDVLQILLGDDFCLILPRPEHADEDTNEERQDECHREQHVIKHKYWPHRGRADGGRKSTGEGLGCDFPGHQEDKSHRPDGDGYATSREKFGRQI